MFDPIITANQVFSNAVPQGGTRAQCYDSLMRQAGFVLAGGRSARMGVDKALLLYRGLPLAARIAAEVLAAAGSVSIVGDPARYGALSFPVVADLVPGLGPIGGLLTALSVSQADWNLVAACDMPGLTRDDLAALLAAASAHDGDCVVAVSPGGRRHPLCAVYHRRCLPAVSEAVSSKRLKMMDLVATLRPLIVPLNDPAHLGNINTPQDWLSFAHGN